MAAHREPRSAPDWIDFEFVFAGEDHTGSYWSLCAINTSPYVLDYLELKGVRRDAVGPGERVFLRQHCVEAMPDPFGARRTTTFLSGSEAAFTSIESIFRKTAGQRHE